MNEQNIAIAYEKMKTIREKRIVHTDYIDENKSVKWNREEIARRNPHVEDELKRFKQQINEFEKISIRIFCSIFRKIMVSTKKQHPLFFSKLMKMDILADLMKSSHMPRPMLSLQQM